MVSSARTSNAVRFVGLAFCATACGSSSKATTAGGTPPADATADVNINAVGTGPCGPNTLQAGTFSLTFQNIKYGYIVHLPPGYDGTKRTPLVLNWHGLTSYASQQEMFSGMDPVADSKGFVLVYPDSPDKSWNAGTCCSSATTRDDVGFAIALVDLIESQTCIDSKRVYTTGMSNGAFMSYRLGCERADVFAAIAPVAGKVGIPNCKPSRPVPLMAFHGTADPLVPYYTGTLSADNLDVPDTVKKWATGNGCSGTDGPIGIAMSDGGDAMAAAIDSDAGPEGGSDAAASSTGDASGGSAGEGGGAAGPAVTYQMGTVTCQTYSGCNAGATVTLCSAVGEGHCWPGTATCPYGNFTTDIDASQQIADFFAKFSLP
jgi:polyhydroxybutyrate depolymerase